MIRGIAVMLNPIMESMTTESVMPKEHLFNIDFLPRIQYATPMVWEHIYIFVKIS